LTALADGQPTAVMCAEADWRDCHCQLIADSLIAEGHEVRHIMKDGVEAAKINPAATQRPEGLVYIGKHDDKAPRLPGL